MKPVLVFLIGILFLGFASAAHYVIGIANDAFDGTSANGFSVVLWNPANGISDNLTDFIGVSGMAGYDNLYMLEGEGGNIVQLFSRDERFAWQELKATHRFGKRAEFLCWFFP